MSAHAFYSYTYNKRRWEYIWNGSVALQTLRDQSQQTLQSEKISQGSELQTELCSHQLKSLVEYIRSLVALQEKLGRKDKAYCNDLLSLYIVVLWICIDFIGFIFLCFYYVLSYATLKLLQCNTHKSPEPIVCRYLCIYTLVISFEGCDFLDGASLLELF